MDTTSLGHARSIGVPLLTVIALSVPCGCALAQSVSAQSEPDSASPGSESTSQSIPAEIEAARDFPGVNHQLEYTKTGAALQRRMRPFGADLNGAPRYTRSDTEVAPWRSLPSLQVAGRYRAELSEISSRWWFSSGRTDVGFGVGSVVLMAQPVMGGSSVDTASAGVAIAGSPAVSVGIRRRTSAASTVYADATRTHSVGVNGIDSYSGKVGVEWKSAESRWSVAYSGLGMRLSPESRMTLSLRKGGLGIYMRSRF